MRYLLVFVLLMLSPLLTFGQTVDEADVISPDNVAELEVLHSWQSSGEGLVAGAFSHAGDFFAIALNDGVVQLLDTTSWEVVSVLDGANLEGTRIQFSRDDSRLMLSHWDGMIRVWELETGELLLSVDAPFTYTWYEVDADLQVYWTHADGGLRIQEIGSDGIQFRSLPIPNTITLDLHPDGHLMAIVTETEDDHLFLFDWVAEEVVSEFTVDVDANLIGRGFSPDGDLLWGSWQYSTHSRSENPSVIRFWSVDIGMEQFEIIGDGSSYSRIVFDPTGDLVAVAGENSSLQNVLQIWNLQTGEYIGDAGVPTGGGIGNFSPNGDLFVLQGGTTPNVHIWNVNTPGRPVDVILEVGSGPNSAPVFSPDGRHVLTINGATIRLWGVPASEE